MSFPERQLADLLISKYKLTVTHLPYTWTLGCTYASTGRCASDLSVSQQRICRPKRNKQICHFLFSSKTRWLSIISTCHFLSVWTRLCISSDVEVWKRAGRQKISWVEQKGKQYTVASTLQKSHFLHGSFAVTKIQINALIHKAL